MTDANKQAIPDAASARSRLADQIGRLEAAGMEIAAVFDSLRPAVRTIHQNAFARPDPDANNASSDSAARSALAAELQSWTDAVTSLVDVAAALAKDLSQRPSLPEADTARGVVDAILDHADQLRKAVRPIQQLFREPSGASAGRPKASSAAALRRHFGRLTGLIQASDAFEQRLSHLGRLRVLLQEGAVETDATAGLMIAAHANSMGAQIVETANAAGDATAHIEGLTSGAQDVDAISAHLDALEAHLVVAPTTWIPLAISRSRPCAPR